MIDKRPALRIGADVGGTFTDVVILDAAGHVWTDKVLSTPPEFEQAVLQAVARLLGRLDAPGQTVAQVAHGTTVATNAVLEHRGAHTALITTRGFRDVLELRRIRAPQLYDLFWEKPRPLIERYLRFELTERMAANGEVVTPLDSDDLTRIIARLRQEGVASVAVCLIHAYANPMHEQMVGQALAEQLPQVQVSLSHEVLRERKEYERTATTVVNAYVRPIMQRYVEALRHGLSDQAIDAPLLIMQSAGGLTPAEDAAIRPVYVLESGPAAGVLAALALARQRGLDNVITLDVGGTTAKASIIENGQVSYSPEYEVGASLSAGNRLVGGGGELIRAPSIDIAEVGAGGGSIAWLDAGGGLRVGPRSAGARPGPACYGRGGTEPTVTDANVVLGYIRPGQLADGSVSIDVETARRAVYDHVARPLGLDLLRAAEGIHRIANARTMRALRAVSTERGRDPREFALIAFGGAGPVHAAGLALELGTRQVIIPLLPGLFSALGLLFSGVEHHDVRSCRLTGGSLTPDALDSLRAEMQHAMLAQFRREGFAPDEVEVRAYADVRFLGQASDIRLPLPDHRQPTTDRQDNSVDGMIVALRAAFLAEHDRLYGHRSDPDNPIEVIAVRLIGRAGVSHETLFRPDPSPVTRHPSPVTRQAYFGEPWGLVDTPVLSRHALTTPTPGPLLIDEFDSTIVVPPFARASVDAQGSLVLERNDA